MRRTGSAVLLMMLWTGLSYGGEKAKTQAPPGSGNTEIRKEFISEYVAAKKKGYVVRACGFDVNRNGIVGEAADRLIGDGETADPDGDGVDEDILYVDSQSGDDKSGDGSAERPFKTIQKVLDTADGPADGAEDIICIAGTFHEALTLKHSGVPGHYVRDGFEFPANPTMIVGWDRDGDGEYPPFDSDEKAVLDGRDRLKLAINNRPSGVGFLEIAHLTIQDYGRPHGQDERGAICLRGRSTAKVQSHLYIHDVEFHRIDKGVTGMMYSSNTIVANFFPAGPGTPDLAHVAFINNLIDEFGGYAFRGAGHGGGAFRFQNNTLRMYGPEGDKVKLSFSAYVTGWKLWAKLTGIEILDNVIDGNPRAWNPKAYASGLGACQCSQDWTIRGNVFVDLHGSVILQGDAGPPYCQSRTVDNVVIDRNIFRNTYKGWAYPPTAIAMRGAIPGSPPTADVGDVSITNNFISSVTGWESGIRIMSGNYSGPARSTITIAGNTISGPFGLFGYSLAQHGISIYPQSRFRPESFVIKNNIITNTGPGKRNVGVNYAPKHWVAGGNIYDPASGFIWDNKVIGFSEWQKATGQDAGSKMCKPALVDVGGGDLHLQSGDACPINVRTDITEITKVDFDGQPRSAQHSIAGADAVMPKPGSKTEGQPLK